MRSEFYSIFKSASRTHYYSSIFFEKKIREEITILYSFLRAIDDLVDSFPRSVEKYFEFKNFYYEVCKGENEVYDDSYKFAKLISLFVELKNGYCFDESWIEALFLSMEMDLSQHKYESFEADTLVYIYGVSEVVGLMVAKILKLPEESYYFSRLLGKSAQFINIIRDINEDFHIGRCYLPNEHLRNFNLDDLSFETVSKNSASFCDLINFEINFCLLCLDEAKQGFRFIKGRSLVPIETISDIYLWTANEIRKNPLVVFERKVKPSKFRVLSLGFFNFLRFYL